jgi:hypothetical protein
MPSAKDVRIFSGGPVRSVDQSSKRSVTVDFCFWPGVRLGPRCRKADSGNQERKEGEITKAQAQKLHKEDRQIRGEERAMASQNGGHITKQEQKTLNQQENAVSRQIGK